MLYRTEQEERSFLGLKDDESLETRFMFFDLKIKDCWLQKEIPANPYRKLILTIHQQNVGTSDG